MDGLHGAGRHRGRHRLRVHRLSPGARRMSFRPASRMRAAAVALGIAGEQAATRTGSSSAAIPPAAITRRCCAVRRDWQAPLRPARPMSLRGCLPDLGRLSLRRGHRASRSARASSGRGCDRSRAASPILGIQVEPPPFLIAHGEQRLSASDRSPGGGDGLRRCRRGNAVERLVLPGLRPFHGQLSLRRTEGPWLRPAPRPSSHGQAVFDQQGGIQ